MSEFVQARDRASLENVSGRRSLRVLLVSSSSGSMGGGELYLVGLAEGLHALGHRVECLLAAHPRMDGLAGQLIPWAAVHRFAFCNTYDRRWRCYGSVLAGMRSREVDHELRRLAPDVIHLNKQNFEDGLDLLLAAQRTGIPLVTTVHITRSMKELGGRGGAVRDWLSRRILRRGAANFITIAGTCAEQFARFLQARPDSSRVFTVLNGVSSAPPGARAELRRHWGCQESDVVLGCVARLEEQKNPLFLLHLMKELPAHVKLLWVGDGRLRQIFLDTARQLGVALRVRLDGWRSDARARLAGFDAFVLPSLYEGLPLAVLEAMAAGLPCLVSDVDSLREAVIDDETGWLCPAGAREVWLPRLAKLAEDPFLRRRFGQRGQERWREHFSLEAMARATSQVYEQAIEPSSLRSTR